MGKKQVEDGEFIADLYEKCYKYLFGIVRNSLYIKDTGEIEACIQQVFLIAMEKEDLLKKHENPELWLAQTARYVCHNYNKKLHLNLSVHDQDCLEEILDSTNIEQETIERILLKEYWNMIKKQLTENEIHLLRLRYDGKRDTKEISDILKVNTICLNARTRRLKGKIKKLLKDI